MKRKPKKKTAKEATAEVMRLFDELMAAMALLFDDTLDGDDEWGEEGD
jgi:hypothetical protein